MDNRTRLENQHPLENIVINFIELAQWLDEKIWDDFRIIEPVQLP